MEKKATKYVFESIYPNDSENIKKEEVKKFLLSHVKRLTGEKEEIEMKCVIHFPSYTRSDAVDSGFIQAQTDHKASLWWSPFSKKIIVFVPNDGGYLIE